MAILFFSAALIVIFSILLLIGLVLLIRAFFLKKKMLPGILFFSAGAIPIFMICLFIYYAFFYVSDSRYKQVFTSDTGLELPASAKIIHKDHSVQIWTDYDEAFIAKMNQADYTIFLSAYQEDSILPSKTEDMFFNSACKIVMEKARINKNDVIWFDWPGTHHKLLGFHSGKQLVIYSRYRY
ncbi:MAG: hypothetical protein LBV72_08745 [Tannerella sp.]|nr:hypothetical protein [Tannerella sp.]